jgi:tRNA(Ile2) C34 agmatinyltransferase TiaS
MKEAEMVCKDCKIDMIEVGKCERNFWCPKCGCLATDVPWDVYRIPGEEYPGKE